MNCIKIPSANIYDIKTLNHENNKIATTSIRYNRFSTDIDNVLDKSYRATYFQREIMESGVPTIKVVYQDLSLNDFIFINSFSNLEGDDIGVTAINRLHGEEERGAWALLGDKAKVIELSSDYHAKNLTIVRSQQLLRTRNNPNEMPYIVEEFYTKTITYTIDAIYSDEIDGLIFPLELESWIGTPTTWIKRSVTVDGYDWVEYLMSETITIEGLCYFTEGVEFTLGDNIISTIYLPTNELVQEINTIGGGNTELYKYIVNKVSEKYSNGKEVYTIKCSIAEYYSMDGSLAISLDNDLLPSNFEKYDIVEPYVFTSNGEEPLSVNADGVPKRFEIIGIDYSYKGVVWQELTIQEYVE